MTQFYAGTTSYHPSYQDGKPAAQNGQGGNRQPQNTSGPTNPHKINISQILVDFRNTISSIGASADIERKVNEYISKVEDEASKEVPRKETIITSLKTASKLLDEYISKTLKKPSNVVQDWIDAFLLQDVDYKADVQKAKISASQQLEAEIDPKVKQRLDAEAEAKMQSGSAAANYNSYQKSQIAQTNTQKPLPPPAQSAQQKAHEELPQQPAPQQEEEFIPVFVKPDGKMVKGGELVGEVEEDGTSKFYTAEEAARKKLEEDDEEEQKKKRQQQEEQEKEQEKAKKEEEKEPEEEPISKNSMIQNFYIKAKKYLERGDSQKALESYRKTLKYAKNSNDKKAQAYIIQGIGKSYDDLNNLARAAKCFNRVTRVSKDVSLKATGHDSLGGVYDEAGKFELAMDHYFEALSLNGEIDNTAEQAKTLNRIGKMKTSQYMTKEAIDFYKLALDMAKQNRPDIATMGSVLSNTADAFKYMNKPQCALKYYQKSLVCANKSSNREVASGAYEKAGDLMRDMRKTQKAQSLYKKAMQEALNSRNTEQVRVLREKMAALV